jgi:hypothetical protein
MDQAIFDDLQSTMSAQGASAAIERLCTVLREQKDYGGLFYAFLLKKRYELGVSPVPTAPAQELPEKLHAPYEDAIRDAGRFIGRLYLDEGDIPRAWMYFRMLGESGPVAEAIEKVLPTEDEEVQQLVDIAYHQGVHPRKGFDLILDRFGICNAITTLGGQEFPHGPEARDYCIKRLVRALHAELCERLKADIARLEGQAPPANNVHELIAGRDGLFAEDFAHVDISHLGSVVQMSSYLPPGEELELARELCAYGERLNPRFQSQGEAPFEDQYRDYGIYLAILAGDRTEEGLGHFRAKVERTDPETAGTMAAEVLVNLLLRLDRPIEALKVARRYLATTDSRQLSCPSITELCRRTNDYRTLAEVSRQQGDAVHFLAGLIANGQDKTSIKDEG